MCQSKNRRVKLRKHQPRNASKGRPFMATSRARISITRHTDALPKVLEALDSKSFHLISRKAPALASLGNRAHERVV